MGLTEGEGGQVLEITPKTGRTLEFHKLRKISWEDSTSGTVGMTVVLHILLKHSLSGKQQSL